jgi:hypothetical protein
LNNLVQTGHQKQSQTDRREGVLNNLVQTGQQKRSQTDRHAYLVQAPLELRRAGASGPSLRVVAQRPARQQRRKHQAVITHFEPERIDLAGHSAHA